MKVLASKKKKQKLSPYKSLNPDYSEPFAQLGVTLLQSPQFKALPPSSRVLYPCMLIEARGHESTPFQFTRKTAERYGIEAKTLYRSLHELEEAGFIKSSANNRHRAKANEYILSLDWQYNNANSDLQPTTPKARQRKSLTEKTVFPAVEADDIEQRRRAFLEKGGNVSALPP